MFLTPWFRSMFKSTLGRTVAGRKSWQGRNRRRALSRNGSECAVVAAGWSMLTTVEALEDRALLTLPSLSINNVTVTEANGPATTNATFTVTLSAANAAATTVKYATVAGTAKAGTDFTAVSLTTLTIPANTLSKTFTVPIVGDTTNEATEAFTVTLSGQSANAKLGTSIGTCTILDNDPLPSLTINDTGGTEGIGNTATFTVHLSAPSGQAVTVNYATSSIGATATAPGDYTAQSSGTLTIPAGMNDLPIAVLLNDDMVYEASEFFFVNLTSTVNATIADNQGKATITDNDAPPVFSINSPLAVTEGVNSTVTFTITKTGGTAVSSTVMFKTADGSAKDPGDYTKNLGTTVTFAPLETTKTVSVAIINDNQNEAPETFTGVLSSATNATIGMGMGTGTATINDNDPVPSLSIDDVSVTEGDMGTKLATFTVKLSGASGQAVMVNYATSLGTAIVVDDYTAILSTPLTFAPGVTSMPVSVTIKGDLLDETDETFFVDLSGATNATISDNQGKGTIIDNDPTPTLSIGNVTVAEDVMGGLATFTVTLSAMSGRDVTVNYTTMSGSATAGADYGTTAGTLTILAGATSGTIDVAVTDDLLDENAETFFVKLSNPTAATITQAQAQGTITDNDAPPDVTFGAFPTVTEGTGGNTTIPFTVNLSAASGLSVKVDFATFNGTFGGAAPAAAGQDYAAKSGTLTFAPGETTKTVLVTVYGDALNEGNMVFSGEIFGLALSNPVNAVTVPMADTAYGFIQDDDAAPTVSITDVTALEGTPSPFDATSHVVTFAVTLSAPSGKTVTMDYATSDDTAMDGNMLGEDSDYMAEIGSLTFAPGETRKLITVLVTKDSANEDNETFNVTLSNVVNADDMNSDLIGVGTIMNDDAVPTLRINDVEEVENQVDGMNMPIPVNAVFTVTLSAASGKTVTVDWMVADGTAEGGPGLDGDYDNTTPGGTLTFLPGQTTQTITVPITGDVLYELDEYFYINLAASANPLTPLNAILADAQGRGTIVNDDAPDTTAPVIETATPSTAGPINAGTALTFAVHFSEAVTGVNLTGTQFTLAGAGSTGATVTSVASVTGSGHQDYVVTVDTTLAVGDGDLTLNFTNDAAVIDGAANAATDFTGADIVVIDNTAPTLLVAAITDDGPIVAGSPITFTIVFVDANSVDATTVQAALLLTGTATGSSIFSVTPIIGVANTYTVVVSTSPADFGKTVILTVGTGVKDKAGNALSASVSDDPITLI